MQFIQLDFKLLLFGHRSGFQQLFLLPNYFPSVSD
jgi:hypothetical protein